MNRTCYIFAAGDFSGSFSKEKNDLIIAADAGYKHLEWLGVSPDIILGDFDSIENIPTHDNVIKFPPEKDYTDTELALLEGIKQGYSKFIICGALGGKRIEHTLANISLASSYAEKGYEITLTDGTNMVSALHNRDMEFNSSYSGFVSVFPFNGKAIGVSETGLKYSLTDAVLDSSNPTLGVSNEFIGQPSKISVKDGTIIIIWQNRHI